MIEILVCLVSLELVRSSEDIIDVNDILSEDLMPTSLLIWEDPEKARKSNNGSASEVTRFKVDGSLTNAMDTMGFHRSMMNQYLCRSYVADRIVSNMTLTRIKRRMGQVTGKETNFTNAETEVASIIKNNLMNDEGSSGYQDWLLKHYNHADNRVDQEINVSDDKEDFDMEFNGQKAVPAPTMHKSGTNGPIKNRGQKDDMFYGGGSAPAEGYHHSSSGSGPLFPHSSQGGGGGYQHSGGGGGGYHHSGGGGGYQHSGGGGNYYGGHPGGHTYMDSPPVHEPEHVYVHHTYPPKSQGHYEHHSGGGKEKELADLFEVALTALAYLAFGMFLVHVVMCISAVNNVATTTMASMMPMSMSPTATAAGMTGGTGMGGGMTGTGNGGGTTGTDNGGTTGTGNGGTTGTGNGGGTTGGTGGGSTGTGGGATGTGDNGAGGDTEPGDDNGGGGDTGMGDDTGNGGATAGGGDGDTTGNGGDAGTGGGTDMDGGNGGNGDTGNGNADEGDATGDNGDNGGTNDEPGTGDGATGGTAGGTTADDTVIQDADNDEMTDMFQFRLKRDIPTLVNANNYYINELARRVLIAIETAMIANNDQGACLKKNLCETNKWSRSLEGKQRIIVPVFSLGMSWISGRLIDVVSPATSRLDALKAVVLGLGKANCEVIYQDCDLKREISKRRMRRRKRQANEN
nr:unnamed protein product [Callosobruchus chinensis]